MVHQCLSHPRMTNEQKNLKQKPVLIDGFVDILHRTRGATLDYQHRGKTLRPFLSYRRSHGPTGISSYEWNEFTPIASWFKYVLSYISCNKPI